MRWFWGLLALVAIAAAALLLVRKSPPLPPVAPPPQPPSASTTPAPEIRPVPPSAPELPAPARPAEPVSVPEKGSAGPEAPAPAAAVTKEPSPGAVDRMEPAGAPPAATGEAVAPAAPPSPAAPATTTASRRPSPEDAEALALKQGLDELLGLVERNPNRAAVEPLASVAPAPPAAAASAGTPAPDAASTARLAPRGDGTTLVDDRFILKGAGTREDPYLITWEMLVSAQETYQPRLGRKIIPDRLKMLDGKWIRIAGFIAFPLMAQSQDEMLMMLNQWDGCCIGVPPTPYDAIEVKLKSAARGDDRLRVSGSVTGILRVDPYLVKDWLVSLYLMDDAELKVDTGSKRDPSTLVPGHRPPE